MEQDQSMRSDIYLLLATLLREAPNDELLEFLSNLEFEDNGTPMASAWASLVSSARRCSKSQLEDEYQELFIGIGRGEVVPFSSWHITGSLMEKPLADIRSDLSLYGLERDEHIKEPEDHISALCETMAFLSEQGGSEQKAFFNRHLSPWFSKLTKQMTQAEHADFYLAVAQLLEAFLSLENVSFTQGKISKRNTHKIDVKNLMD